MAADLGKSAIPQLLSAMATLGGDDDLDEVSAAGRAVLTATAVRAFQSLLAVLENANYFAPLPEAAAVQTQMARAIKAAGVPKEAWAVRSF